MSLLKNAKKFLKRNGRIIVMNWKVDPKTPRGPPMKLRPTEEDTLKCLRASGYVAPIVLDVPPYHYAVIAHQAGKGV